MEKKVKVLIADDSAVYRTQIRMAIQELSWVEIVGTASNGVLALERLSHHKPDLLILDLEMPELDGLQTLVEMNRLDKCKVLVFSSLSSRGAKITMEALYLGASDFITKPSAEEAADKSSSPTEKIKALLVPKIKALFPTYDGAPALAAARSQSQFPRIHWELLRPKIVLIGSSTGGPTVLERIFAEISPPVNCPIVIAQHMPPIFTTTFAERLEKVSGIQAREAVHGEALRANRIYVAPGDFHLRLGGTASEPVALLDQGPQINSVRPAVDALFASAAALYRDRCLALVLTGMGSDGRDGAVKVKEAGGAVLIQNEESCVVYGMPGAVASVGAYDKIVNPREIVEMLNEKLTQPVFMKKAAGGAE